LIKLISSSIVGLVPTKTALNIDRDLVASAAEVLGTSGTTATIDAALRAVIDRAARERLMERIRKLEPADREAILSSWNWPVATHLIDKSAWVRLGDHLVDPRWPQALLNGSLAVTGVAMIEILVGARSPAEFGVDRRDLESMPRVALNEHVVERALDVQGLMVRAGTHRAPSPSDLVLAACAELNGLIVLHYDKDFDLIAAVTHQPTQWLAPPGLLH
jgi:predicted nucleic acid-binding protein/Arc/MetJ family transcription regulator